MKSPRDAIVREGIRLWGFVKKVGFTRWPYPVLHVELGVVVTHAFPRLIISNNFLGIQPAYAESCALVFGLRWVPHLSCDLLCQLAAELGITGHQ